jgi:muramoyltetrapeptide carboxypeptidase
VTAGFEEDGIGAVGTYAYAPVPGNIEGISLGGNLSALGSLMGTPFQPHFNEAILLLEDADEKRDILERWFTNLHLAGALQKSNAICLGKFDRCEPRGLKNSISIEEQISTRVRELNKISCFDFLFGQGGQFGATALGVRARLETAKGKIEFLEPAFS